MKHKFRKLGGYSAILSGLLLMIAHSLNLGGSNTYGTVLGDTLVLSGHTLLVFAFIGLYEYQGDRNGVLGWCGMVAGTLGTILVTAIVYVETAGASGVPVVAVFASEFPNTIQSVFPLLFVIGMIFFGVSVIRAKVLPRGGGYALVAGTLIFASGSFTGQAQAIFSFVGAIFTGVGFCWLGLSMLKRRFFHR